MAISRMNMERQLRAGGGIMTLEEPRQGYFLGKLVKKAKRAVKKVVKSPLGKAAIIGGLGMYAGGLGPFASGSKFLGGALSRIPGAGFGSGIISGLGSGKGFLGTIGNAFRVGGDPTKGFSGLRILGGLGAAGAIAAPFLMGGDDEEETPDTSFTETPSSIANIVQQARNRDESLRFLPEPKFVRNFYAAEGGLANIPREGYKFGEMVEGLSMLTPAGAGMAAGKKLAESIKDDESMDMAGIGNVMKLFTNERTGFDRAGFEDMLIQYEDSGAKKRGIKLMDFAIDFLGISSMKEGGRVPMQEGGLMDLGGMEKDYRTGGFVDLGAKERADDVPARLSKNEFVFTAKAVRNAGGGDIDKGAEVMQNMMDNLEAGGTISEESQGMNPAQEMFDQAQMLEGRLA